jgi:hypothetical protein
MHRDEFGERLNTERGECGDAIFAEANDEEAPIFRVHFAGDVLEPL